MPEIWIKKTHTIIGKLRTEPQDGPFVFSCHQDDLKDCQLIIDPLGENIVCKARIEISNELFNSLDQDIAITDLPQELESEMTQKGRLLVVVTRRILRLIQQEIQDPKLLPANELSSRSGGNLWSVDGENWRQINGLRAHVALSSRVIGELTDRWRVIVQDLLDQGEEPLIALQHLYEAERSSGLRFKWIEATIAAELAIKEILIRIEPKLSVVLVELPSPPIKKLYGEVLESLTGEKSPFRKELHEGSEIRNRLIHRPEAEKLNHQQVINYLDTVAKAIRHLLDLQRRMRT
jgi:hypothetical protein